MATRGFSGKGRPASTNGRLPPGQFVTEDFPVLSAGPTPRIALENWRFTLKVGPRPVKQWSWREFISLPVTASRATSTASPSGASSIRRGRACRSTTSSPTPASKRPTEYVLAHSVDGYSTNVPTKDLVGGRGMIAVSYDGTPIPADHGGPARLLVPHLYFWKSAKWVNALQFTERDEAGFWELRGYHMYGDPWQEQRYSGD